MADILKFLKLLAIVVISAFIIIIVYGVIQGIFMCDTVPELSSPDDKPAPTQPKETVVSVK